MKLTFIGADHEVTGSCHMVEAAGKTFLVDYGMEQGTNLYENIEIPVAPGEIDFVLLTHAHIDHSGLLPLLNKRGFGGQIYATEATTDLCRVMLQDSAHIQEFEAEWKNRKNRRAGLPDVEPIYTTDDASRTSQLFVPCPYHEKIEIAPGIEIRFSDVGHLLGSACIEVWLREDGVEKKLVFSGDVGNINQPIIKDPEKVDSADYVIVESTYGDRVHEAPPDYVLAFSEILQDTFDRGGNVVIPSFAVGRTQEILYFVREVKEKGLVHGHDGFEVYVDSPLAIEATTVFDKHEKDCFDSEALELVRKGVRPFIFEGLKTTVTSEESKAINFDTKPKLIISASGMCEAGRIRHHLKHNLWRADSTVLFVGFQAIGTLGRKLIEGEKEVKLFGETIEVKARIASLKGVSGHADQKGLLDWLTGFTDKPEKVFVVHGEDDVTDEFAKLITEFLDVPALAPYSGGRVDLATGEVLSLGDPVVITRKEPKEQVSEKTQKAKNFFHLLLAAGRRLTSIISSCEGRSNRDLEKFEKEVTALCDKWE